MSNAEINMENVVVLFKNFEDLKRDEGQILKEYAAEWERAYVMFDMTEVAFNKDETALAKFDGADLALAKSEAERLRSSGSMTTAKVQALVTLTKSLKAAVDRRNDRLFGHTALAKRSMRFASAHARRSYGAGATSLPPSA
jgi:hypothetical protein